MVSTNESESSTSEMTDSDSDEAEDMLEQAKKDRQKHLQDKKNTKGRNQLKQANERLQAFKVISISLLIWLFNYTTCIIIQTNI